MGVEYIVCYHHAVPADDIPLITQAWKKKIQKAIETKLTKEPMLYGKPLRRSLQGYYRLRVGDYRVIYRVESGTVRILMIKHRSVVYAAVDGRL